MSLVFVALGYFIAVSKKLHDSNLFWPVVLIFLFCVFGYGNGKP